MAPMIYERRANEILDDIEEHCIPLHEKIQAILKEKVYMQIKRDIHFLTNESTKNTNIDLCALRICFSKAKLFGIIKTSFLLWDIFITPEISNRSLLHGAKPLADVATIQMRIKKLSITITPVEESIRKNILPKCKKEGENLKRILQSQFPDAKINLSVN